MAITGSRYRGNSPSVAFQGPGHTNTCPDTTRRPDGQNADSHQLHTKNWTLELFLPPVRYTAESVQGRIFNAMSSTNYMTSFGHSRNVYISRSHPSARSDTYKSILWLCLAPPQNFKAFLIDTLFLYRLLGHHAVGRGAAAHEFP